MKFATLILSASFAGLIGPGAVLSAADPASDFEKHLLEVPGEIPLPYRLLRPESPENGQAYPLVIFLHGIGERGSDNEAQLRHGGCEFADPDNRRQFPCFVAAPQCPSDDYWMDIMRYLGFTWFPQLPDTGPTAPLKSVMQLIDKLPRELPIDPDRIYITGISMGGFGTWDLAQRMPQRFAAVVPVCGGGLSQNAARLTSLPMWVFHGGADHLVPREQSRRMVQAIRSAGGHPLYTEYPGVDHDCWTITYRNPLLMTWLFEQRRSLPSEGTSAASQ